ncbi:hypothetical protein C2857_005085 [Epichloe festucae Fl1]|uniref:Uncharacterized protein n=1 Tax=Epichloe festucae (strain Fl1) TaxID=877507 RepID=A0A7S9KPC0_EPIFF|nr:hypothetical protein C2857_005085 [Epichloe festucae Fl1]
MIRELVSGAVALIILAYTIEYMLSMGDDPREPPVVRPRIPVVGQHILGIMRGGPTYYSDRSNSTSAEMHTLRIFIYKIYVSTSNRLLPMIQK